MNTHNIDFYYVHIPITLGQIQPLHLRIRDQSKTDYLAKIQQLKIFPLRRFFILI